MRHTLFAVLASLFLVASDARSQVVINEVNTLNDFVEIANLGPVPVDISGWHLIIHEQQQLIPGAQYQFPGAPGSLTTVLNPEQCAVVTDSATLAFPIVPVGTLIFYFGQNNPWNSTENGSCMICDDLGNGVDWFGFGNPNAFLTPFEGATFLGLPGAPAIQTLWFGPASPDNGLINTLDTHYRHSRSDTDTAADWTMRADATNTPGTLNYHQVLPAAASGTPPTVSILPLSPLTGIGPHPVAFINASQGDCILLNSLWDFDFANPGTLISSKYNEVATFAPVGTPGSTVTYNVVLAVLDALGGYADNSTAPTVVTVTVGEPVVPVATTPTVERFEGPLGPNGTSARGFNGWQWRRVAGNGRVRTVDPRTLTGTPAAYVDATPTSGPVAAILDSSSGAAAVQLELHVDALALGAGFTVRYWAYNNLNEVNSACVVAVQDGVTPGQAVLRTGAPAGIAGTDGFREVLLNDWLTTATPARTWTFFEHFIDPTFLINNGLLPTNTMRIIFRQADNTTYEGSDGLLIDEVSIVPLPVPGPGQPGSPGVSMMNINGALNANGNPVGLTADLNGPFFATATVGQPLTFEFDGEANQPIILLYGALNPAAAVLPIVGQLDLGTPNPNPPFIPTGVSVMADGTQVDFINSLFNTTPSGSQTIVFTTPSLPPGVFGSFQALTYNSTLVAVLSNTIELTIQ